MTPSARPGLSYVVNSLNPGGTERLVVEMSCAFSEEYDVQVLCLDDEGAWAGELRSRGIEVHALGRKPGMDLALPAKLGSHFRHHGARIVHAHQCTAWFYAALSRVWYPRPRLLFEEHGRFYPEVASPARALVNRVLIRKLTHRFVAVSSDIRERLQRFEGLDAGQIEVVYNGVAPAERLSTGERDALRRELGFGTDDFVVGTVGRFDPIKNLPMLVASLEAAGHQVSALRGLLIGDGPVFAEIGSLVRQGAMRDRIQLTGYRSDARRLTQALDLFVLSSFSEGTSMALLEAMAAGVPVAVTEVGGNPEIVQDGETGWTVPSESTDALTQVIVEAVSDCTKRSRLARAGRRRFEDKFAMDRMIGSYREQYRELLLGRS
jgi:glycosyltransferase involved in cell wall biosynthesis